MRLLEKLGMTVVKTFMTSTLLPQTLPIHFSDPQEVCWLALAERKFGLWNLTDRVWKFCMSRPLESYVPGYASISLYNLCTESLSLSEINGIHL